MKELNRNTYEAPVLVHVGSLERVTLGKADGGRLDQSFPVLTPKSDLTFS